MRLAHAKNQLLKAEQDKKDLEITAHVKSMSDTELDADISKKLGP